VSLEELDADLSERAPRGIFTGVHDDDLAKEEPLLAYAQAQGYVPIALPDEGILWASPIAAWDDRIALGAIELPNTAAQPGEQILTTLHLQAMQPITSNLNVLVRLVNPSGQEAARSEGWPWGRATSTWQPGEVWPDGHTLSIAADAAPGPYRVEVSFYDPATLDLLGSPATAGHLVIAEPQPEDPAPAPLAQFGDGIVLSGAVVPQEGWQPGATQVLDLTWLAETANRGRYTVFLHFIGPTGTLAAQGDQEPWQGAYPTDAWLAGVPARDRYQLALPEDMPGGEYSLVVGLYDPVTQQRLPLIRNGSAVGDSYRLAAIRVP
jgi:hypothetical protein